LVLVHAAHPLASFPRKREPSTPQPGGNGKTHTQLCDYWITRLRG
jgi:hypothetical protein